MTNKVGFLLLFGSVLLLTACSGKVEKTELTSQTSEISTTSTTEIELKPEEKYASIIEKFEKLSTNGNDSLKSSSRGNRNSRGYGNELRSSNKRKWADEKICFL